MHKIYIQTMSFQIQRFCSNCTFCHHDNDGSALTFGWNHVYNCAGGDYADDDEGADDGADDDGGALSFGLNNVCNCAGGPNHYPANFQ